MHRILAIIERDLRRFRRSPTLIIVSMIMPLVQLVVLGYAFGGKVKHLTVGVVDQDHGLPAVKLKEMFQAVAANARTFETVAYSDQGIALRDLRQGKLNAVLNIPPRFSRNVLAGIDPCIALIEDNTDQFAAAALEGALNQMLVPYNQKPVSPRLSTAATLSIVEVYPYVPYIQYLLPGTIVLAIFVSACVALYETILRFIHPQHLTHLWVLALAGVVGFFGNEVAAQVRLHAGQRLASAAMTADGNHARIDGFVSLGVVASAIVVALGAQIADPIIGLAITIIILKITWDSWNTVHAAKIDLEHVGDDHDRRDHKH